MAMTTTDEETCPYPRVRLTELTIDGRRWLRGDYPFCMDGGDQWMFFPFAEIVRVDRYEWYPGVCRVVLRTECEFYAAMDTLPEEFRRKAACSEG